MIAIRPITNGANGSQQYTAATTGLAATALEWSGAECSHVGVYVENYPAHIAFGTSAVATATAYVANKGTTELHPYMLYLVPIDSTVTHFSARGIGGTATITLTFFAG